MNVTVKEIEKETIEISEEDKEDLKAFQERENDPTITHEEMIERLKKDGRI